MDEARFVRQAATAGLLRVACDPSSEVPNISRTSTYFEASLGLGLQGPTRA
jgi:hypothetical protein